jgi:hypothetical protein
MTPPRSTVPLSLRHQVGWLVEVHPGVGTKSAMGDGEGWLGRLGARMMWQLLPLVPK